MRGASRRFRGLLLVAAFLTGVGADVALAQELQLDPKALDTSGASSVQLKRKGKKGADAAAPQAAGKSGQQSGPNRQFGELEGWSPGKAPPKTKEQMEQEDKSSPGKGSVNMTPSGSVGVGLPF